MNTEENTAVMAEAQTSASEQGNTSPDAFLTGWGEGTDDAVPEKSTAPDETSDPAPEEAAAETNDGEEEPKEGEESDPAAAADGQPAPEAAPRTYELTYMGEKKTVTEAEAPALLQKGLDYDRIRERYDEAKPVMQLFTEFAKREGMSVSDYVAHIRQQAKIAEGMSEDEAKRAVAFEDREADLQAREEAARSDDAQRAEAQKKQEEADAARNADLKEFRETFPDAAKEPDKIPKSVWDDVNAGMRLTAAYAKYAVAAAKTEAAQATQAAKNNSRSTGSMKGAGEQASKDPFLEGFGS